jgi:hypothetical protein
MSRSVRCPNLLDIDLWANAVFDLGVDVEALLVLA